MDFVTIPGHTRVLGAPKGWNNEEVPVGSLPVAEVVSGGEKWMVSAWKPSAEELAQLNANGSVHLWIMGNYHPVVGISVDRPSEDK